MRTILFTFFFGGALAFRSAAEVAVGGSFFFAAAPHRIQYTSDGTSFVSFPDGNPSSIAGFGNMNLAFYAAANGTVLSALLDHSGAPDLTGWLIQTSAPDQRIAPIPGGSPGIIVTLDATLGGPGTTEEVELVGWTGNFPDFQSAMAAGTSALAWSGSVLSGGGFGWSQLTGPDTNGNYPGVTSGTAQFKGLVFATPEPSSIALGIFGAGALLLFRRRR